MKKKGKINNNFYVPSEQLLVDSDFPIGTRNCAKTDYTQDEFRELAKKEGKTLLTYRNQTEALFYALQHPEDPACRRFLKKEFIGYLIRTDTNIRFIKELPKGYVVEHMEKANKEGRLITIPKEGYIVPEAREKISNLPMFGGTIVDLDDFLKKAYGLKVDDLSVPELSRFLRENAVEFFAPFNKSRPRKQEVRNLVRSFHNIEDSSVIAIEEIHAIRILKTEMNYKPSDHFGSLTARLGKDIFL